MTILPPSPPRWAQNYDLGWIGFVHHHNFLANAIAWCTRYWRVPKQPSVSHVFIVSGPNTCIEANAPGVQETSLVQYFCDSRYTIFLRQPRGWNSAMAASIVTEARKYVGQRYDFALIAADAISYSLLGHIVNGLTGDALDRALTAIADRPKQMICDKLGHVCLNAQPALHNLGTLAFPARESNPQRLFSDDAIFSPIATQIQGTPA